MNILLSDYALKLTLCQFLKLYFVILPPKQLAPNRIYGRPLPDFDFAAETSVLLIVPLGVTLARKFEVRPLRCASYRWLKSSFPAAR